jgi:hypothetical protein
MNGFGGLEIRYLSGPFFWDEQVSLMPKGLVSGVQRGSGIKIQHGLIPPFPALKKIGADKSGSSC